LYLHPLTQGIKFETEAKDSAKLMALNFLIYYLPNVTESAGNDLLQFSDMFDFEGTETLGKSILNSLPQFSCNVFLIGVSAVKIFCIEL
jgi:hypothetical protein